MTGSTFENALMAIMAYKEAPDEAINAQLALCHVVVNRASAGWHRGSIFRNLTMMFQGKTPLWHVQFPDEVNEPGFQTLLQYIDTLNTLPDMTDGALYYVRADDPTGLKNLKEATRTSQVGSFLFFK